MGRQVVVLDKDVAERISDMLHVAEAEHGVIWTEFQDEMWGLFTDAILAAVELKP